jgi:hypothetical protein
MRWNLIAPVLCPALLCASTVRAEDAACTPSRKTIADYVLLLPDKYAPEWSPAERKLHRGEVDIDVKHGYAEFSDYAESRTTLALFSKPDGSAMIASSFSGTIFPANREPEDISELNFWICKAGKLVDVTQEVLPVKVNKDFEYKLPRIGTTIVVLQPQTGRLYSLVWKKGKFILQP